MELVKILQIPLRNSIGKTKRSIDEKSLKFNKNEEENRKMGLNLLASKGTLRKSCMDDKYLGKKKLSTQ